MLNSKPRFLLAVLALSFCFCAAAIGQATAGSVHGTVRDSTGAVLPGATVTITDLGKGTKKTICTDATGDYAFPSLIPGTYSLAVEMNGFKRSVQSSFPLDIDQKADLDFTLEPGGASETVEVTTAAPLIKTDGSELGDVVGEHQVQDLPLNGRNFAQLVYLVPGVTTGQAGENLSGSSSFNPRAASDFNALGSQANTNAYLVDGIVDNEWTFNTVMVQPSVASVGEFKVLTGSYSAEYGGGSGVVSTSTRSGANALHGEVFTYLRNSAADARNYFARVGVSEKPAYRRGQYGGDVGGAFKRDKLFYFADYYGQRSLKGITNLNSVPTDAERLGDFSNYTDSTGKLIPIYDPLTTTATTSGGKTVFTRTQFMGCDGAHPNVICSTRLNQTGLNVASIYPEPQISGSQNNFISTANQLIDDNGGNVRIDYHKSDKDSMFGRWSYEKFIEATPNPLTGGQGTCCLPPNPAAVKKFDLGPFVAGTQNTTLIAQGLAVDEVHFFTPTTFNEYRMGYSRTNPFTFQSDYGHNSATSLGMQGLNVSPYTTGLPNFTIGGSCGSEFTCIQGGQAFLPAHPRQTDIQFEDTISLNRGKHSLKFGFRYVRVMASPFTNTTTRGGLTFNDNYTNTASLNAVAPAIVAHAMTNQTPSMQTYTFGIERQFLGGVAEIAYAGSHSVHLTYAYNPNEVGLIQPGGPTSTTARRLIQPLNNVSTWVQEDPINASNYNGLQVKYSKRYSHGLLALIDYTYSKSLDYGGSAASGGGSAGNPQTVTNLKAGYGASGFDQKHRLVSSINYDLPMGPGKTFLNNGIASHVLGGFEVDAITTYGSGAPFTVTLNSGVNSGAPSWPNRIGKGKIDHGNPQGFFDTTAFVAPPPNTYGNSARSVLYGPSTKNWDISLQRKVTLHESQIVSFRFDAFNAFNTPNFATPNAAIGGANAGKILGTVNENRDLQASATFHLPQSDNQENAVRLYSLLANVIGGECA